MSKQQHPSYQGRIRRATAPEADEQTAPEPAEVYTPAAQYAGRACCCRAQPAVIVVISPSAGRPEATDLLLCGHHYRAALPALAARGATIVDISGRPLTPGEWPTA